MFFSQKYSFSAKAWEGSNVPEVSKALTKFAGGEAAIHLMAKDPDQVITQDFQNKLYSLTASLVVLTERQAYTIALSQRSAPFNAEAQTLDELRANAKRYAPDLLKMLTGE